MCFEGHRICTRQETAGVKSARVQVPETAHLIQFFGQIMHYFVQQRLCSPDMAPCDFWLFLQFKMARKVKRFDDIDTVGVNTTERLSRIPKIPCIKSFPAIVESLA